MERQDSPISGVAAMTYSTHHRTGAEVLVNEKSGRRQNRRPDFYKYMKLPGGLGDAW